tara:strand:+ start:335 stop:721 length:387 start_codon:yes stop_codon:yes gene_type:complete
MKEILLTFDGGAKPNPGEGYGSFRVRENDELVFEEIEKHYGSNMTNNQTEYRALIRGCKKIIEMYEHNISLKIKGDSELIIKQIKGEYKVKNKRMKPLYTEVMNLLSNLDLYEIEYWDRENSVREFGH